MVVAFRVFSLALGIIVRLKTKGTIRNYDNDTKLFDGLSQLNRYIFRPINIKHHRQYRIIKQFQMRTVKHDHGKMTTL